MVDNNYELAKNLAFAFQNKLTPRQFVEAFDKVSLENLSNFLTLYYDEVLVCKKESCEPCEDLMVSATILYSMAVNDVEKKPSMVQIEKVIDEFILLVSGERAKREGYVLINWPSDMTWDLSEIGKIFTMTELGKNLDENK